MDDRHLHDLLYHQRNTRVGHCSLILLRTKKIHIISCITYVMMIFHVNIQRGMHGKRKQRGTHTHTDIRGCCCRRAK